MESQAKELPLTEFSNTIPLGKECVRLCGQNFSWVVSYRRSHKWDLSHFLSKTLTEWPHMLAYVSKLGRRLWVDFSTMSWWRQFEEYMLESCSFTYISDYEEKSSGHWKEGERKGGENPQVPLLVLTVTFSTLEAFNRVGELYIPMNWVLPSHLHLGIIWPHFEHSPLWELILCP